MRGRNSTTNESRVLRFLSGCGRRLRARAHKQGPEPGLAGDRLAAFRIVSDRRARIRLIKSQSASTVSEPALKWRREPSNGSRNLSRLAADGWVGFAAVSEDARLKRPAERMPGNASAEGMDWGEACGLSMALHARAAGRAAVVADGH